jgi:OOP family OmpA-OmpF porin
MAIILALRTKYWYFAVDLQTLRSVAWPNACSRSRPGCPGSANDRKFTPKEITMTSASLSTRLFTALIAALGLTSAAQAKDNTVADTGPYAGIELSRAHFGIASALPTTRQDRNDTGASLYGGYRFTPNFGLEGGYARFGSLSETATVAGSAVQQDAKARSLYGAATAMLPLTDALALRGKLGVSWGKVWGANQLPAADSLIGSQTSLMGGVGIDYRLNRDVTLTADYSNFGKVSDKVRASTVGVGAKITF